MKPTLATPNIPQSVRPWPAHAFGAASSPSCESINNPLFSVELPDSGVHREVLPAAHREPVVRSAPAVSDAASSNPHYPAAAAAYTAAFQQPHRPFFTCISITAADSWKMLKEGPMHTPPPQDQ